MAGNGGRTCSALLGLLFMLGSVYGQNQKELKGPKLNSLGHVVHGGHLKVHFDLPYAGMVDFHLAHHTGERFYTNYYDKDKGQNQIVINVGKLDQEKIYQYHVAYKGHTEVFHFRVGADKDGATYTVAPVEE